MIAHPTRLRLGVAALIVAVIGVVAAPATVVTGRGSSPDHWDPRLQPIAEKVEKLRSLDFEHPVAVRYLADAEFERRQRTDRSKLSEADERDLRRSQSQLRALGLIGDDVDLFEANNDIRASGVLAYYDPATERVTVKGKPPLDVATRVVLAHELTHALQDQHFDLARINRIGDRSHASGATRALIEGDATRIEGLYRNELSTDDQAAERATRESAIEASQIDAEEQAIPSVLSALFQAPYALGPPLVDAVDSAVDGGIDQLFEHPPTNESAFLTPSTVVDHAQFKTHLPRPRLDGGSKVERDVFGAFALYLTLAPRLGPDAALRVADGWGGDTMVTYSDAGQTCLKVRFVGRDAASTAAIGDVLDQWAVGVQGATVTRADKPGITFTTCDTGTAQRAPTHSGDEVLAYVGFRNTVYAGLLGQGAASKAAKCTADAVVREPNAASLLEHPDQEPTQPQIDAIRSRVPAIASRCAH